MGPEQHAVLAPSSAAQWGNCSGSIAAQSGVPNQDTEQTREGTAAHWVVSEVLTNHKQPGRGPLVCGDYIDKMAPNGVLIDEKIVEGAQIMVDDVLEVCSRFDCINDLLVEHRVYMRQIHEQNWGTLDSAVFIPDQRLLFLWDYKHGHRDTQPAENFQLIDYAWGLVEELGINGYDDQQITVVMRIVQPFCYYARGPVKEWIVKLSDLRAYWNRLHTKAHEAFNNPLLTTGIWCRDCRAVGKCAATRKARYNFIELVNEPYEMDSMSAEDLAVEMGILENGLAVAKARLEAIEDELKHRVQSGDGTSGYTIQSISGRLKWGVPASQAKALLSQFGVDIGKDDVLTPNQAIKKTPADKRPFVSSIIKRFTTQNSAIKLVPVSESRTARAFKNKTE